jgi:cullin 3
MAERLDRVIQIFRFLQDKDVFEGLYTASLAKRLLEARGINDEAERVLLLKLKEECGFAFTQRLEVMYKDVKLSEELTRDFQQTQTYQQLQPLELSLKVLTTGHWPLEQKEQPPVSLPRELSNAMAAFTAFYQHRFNNVRTLHWRLSQGQADLRSRLNSATRFEFQCSTYQMCLLLLFNQHQELTYLQICQLVPIHTTEL